MSIELYNYQATCTRVIDGDTIVCDIDLGFYTIIKYQIFRLARINAPELPTPEGIKSKEFLKKLIEGKDIVVKSGKLESAKEIFGRWLGEIYFNCENVNDILLKSGNVVLYKY